LESRTIPGDEARTATAGRHERLAELVLRRTKLSASEASLFREVFPAIFAAHYEAVWQALRSASARWISSSLPGDCSPRSRRITGPWSRRSSCATCRTRRPPPS